MARQSPQPKARTQAPKRAAIYIRVSTVRQSEEGGGLEAQLSECRRYATALGHRIVMEDSDTVSGKQLDKREGLDRVLRAAQRGDFDILIVREVSRFARSAKDALAVAEELISFGVGVSDVKGQSSENKLLFTILAAIAEYEADLIRERLVGGRVVAAQQGRWIGGSTPFGYRVSEDKMLEVYPPEADVIASVFNMTIQPDRYPSASSVARELRRRGIRPRIRQWEDRDVSQVFGHSHIQAYLSDTIYKGDGRNVTIGGEEIVIPAPAIVSPEVWDLANEIVAKRHNSRFKNPNNRTYALSGRLFHRHPDGTEWPMWGELKIRKGDYPSQIRLYRCSTVKEGEPCPGTQVPAGSPRRTTVNAEEVEARVLGWALGHLNDPALFAKTIRERQIELIGEDEAEERQILKERIDSIPARRSRWIEQYADGLIDRAARDAKLTQLASEEADLQEALAKMHRVEAITPDDLLEELRTLPIVPFEPGPGDFDPTDAEWPDVLAYLRRAVTEYARSRAPLPEVAKLWTEHVAEVLDLRLVVIDRDQIEETWIGSGNRVEGRWEPVKSR